MAWKIYKKGAFIVMQDTNTGIVKELNSEKVQFLKLQAQNTYDVLYNGTSTLKVNLSDIQDELDEYYSEYSWDAFRFSSVGANNITDITSASNVTYDNTVSGLPATDIQEAMDLVSSSVSSIATGDIVYVSEPSNLPAAISGVRTLLPNVTYFFTTTVDLLGDRLVCGANTTILGASSENCRIKSTGLTGTALITSVYSLPIRNITIEANVALNLDGDGTTTALDWFGVNFTNCPTVGTIKDYSNFIMADSAFLNSGGLTFDGTIGTVGFSQCLFDVNGTNTAFILPSTLTISRRFRIIYSSFVVTSGQTGINVNASATIPTEAYILDTVNFAGGGTYLSGVDHTSNDALFINCTNITNTAVNGQLYMQGNATATTIASTANFYKVLGTTTASTDNSKFSHSNNRLTCDAVISRKYLIQCSLAVASGANNVLEFGFYDSQLSAVRTPSRTKVTANGTGRAESVTFMCVVTMKSADYIEIWCRNTSATTSITVEQLNFTITEIK